MGQKNDNTRKHIIQRHVVSLVRIFFVCKRRARRLNYEDDLSQAIYSHSRLNPMKRIVILTLLLTSFTLTSAMAQSDLPDDQKAVCCFDLQVEKLLASDLAKTLGPDTMEQIKQNMDLPIPPEKFKRIFGLMGAPNSMEEVMSMRPEPAPPKIMEKGKGEQAFTLPPKANDLPFGMLFEFELVDAQSANELFASMLLDPNSRQEINGVQFFSPPSFAPQNIIAGIKDKTKVVFGTKNYVLASSPRVLFSDSLKKTWGQRSNSAPARLSLEMMSKADLVKELVEMGRQFAPPEAKAMLDLVEHVESLNLMIDPSGEELVALHGLGKNDEGSVELREGVNGLLALARFASAGPMSQMQEKAPKAARMMKSITNDLKASGEGRQVNVVVNRPEGMKAAVMELKEATMIAANIAQKKNDLRQVVLAMHNYASTTGELPFKDAPDRRHVGLSWRASVLPFVEELAISDHLDMKKSSGEEPNKAFADKMPKVFGTDGKNSTIVFVRTEEVPKDLSDIRDGTSNTICMVEFPQGVAWLENKDVTPAQVIEMVKNLKEGESRAAAFYDGSVWTLRAGMDTELLKKLLTPSGGETFAREELVQLR